jgi:hypothetical protein
MERFTMRITDNVYYTKGKYEQTIPAECESWDVREILKRLADYEDTGLEPKEIACCINILKDKCWACSNARAYRIGNSNLKTCHHRMKGCVAATGQSECEHWVLDTGCFHREGDCNVKRSDT